MTENVEKAFWDARHKLWLMPLRPGKELPQGAQLFVGKSGGKYYFFPGQQENQAGLAGIQGQGGAQPGQAPQVAGGGGVQPQAAEGQPQRKVRAVQGPVQQQQVVGDIRMEDLPPEQRLEQPWRVGKFPINITITNPETGQKKSSVKWMLPNNYLAAVGAGKDYKLDEARMEEYGLRMPTPEDPGRMHSHEGDVPEHPVNKPHEDEIASGSHRNEIENYDRLYYGKRPAADWMDRYKVDVKPDTRVKFGGTTFNATKYVSPGLEKPIYLFEDEMRRQYVHGPENIKRFNRTADAVKYVQDMFQKYGKVPQQGPREDWAQQEEYDPEAEDMADPRLANLYGQKALLDKINKEVLIVKALDLVQKASSENYFVKYKSGEDTLTMEGLEGGYTLKMNGTPIMKTEYIEEAMPKFYREIGKMIQNQVHDKDTALTMFGEKVVNINREVIPKLNNIGKSADAGWIQNLDLDLLKYEPQNDFFGIVPTQEDMGQGTAEGGKKPGGPVKYTRTNVGEDLVELKDIDGAAPDSLEAYPVEPPVKLLDETYQMRNHPREQDPIMAKSMGDPSDSERLLSNEAWQGEGNITPEMAKAAAEKFGVDLDKYDFEELLTGLNDEREHNDITGGDPEKVVKIVLAHLDEEPDYYSKIAKVLPDLQKAFWDAKRRLWMEYLKAGEALPAGAVLFRSKRGTLYYYFPERQFHGPGGEKPNMPRDVQAGHGVIDEPFGRGMVGTRDPVPMKERIRSIKNPQQAGYYTARHQKEIGGQRDPRFRAAKPGEGPVENVGQKLVREVAQPQQEAKKPGTPEATPDWERRAAERELFRRAEAERIERQNREKEEARRLIAEEARLKALEAEKKKLEFRSKYAAAAESLKAFEDPNVQKQISDLETKDPNVLEVQNQNNERKFKAIGSLIDAAKAGDLDDIVPGLAKKSAELEGKAKELQEINKLTSAVAHSNKFSQADKDHFNRFIRSTFTKMVIEDTEIHGLLMKDISSSEELGGGANYGKLKIRFKEGGKAAFKSKRGEQNLRGGLPAGEMYLREVLSYQVDKILGLGVVPPTGFRITHVDAYNEDSIGSIQKWAAGQEGGGYSKDEGIKGALFDCIAGNTDRHGHNYIGDGNKLWLIDNQCTFQQRIDGGGNRSRLIYDLKDRTVPPDLLTKVKDNRDKIIGLITESVGLEAGMETEKRIDDLLSTGKVKDWVRE